MMSRHRAVSSFGVLLAGFALAQAAARAEEVAKPAASIELSAPKREIQKITAEDLRQLPRTEIEVREKDGSMSRYSGVEMAHLLDKIGVPRGEKLRGEWMQKFVVVEAADDYRVVFAIPEFDSAFTDRKVILADSRNGEPLGENVGPFQIIAPSEGRHARWVRMVTAVRIMDSRSAPETAEVH
jgi:hypothetical protein